MTDLARHVEPVTYEQLAVMAALRGIRIPALAPGEFFEPPTGDYLEPVQEPLRFDGDIRWWRHERRMVGDPPIGPYLPAPWDR